MARAGAELLADADLVAPVPLHWRRLFMRRYNQAFVSCTAAQQIEMVDAIAAKDGDLAHRAHFDHVMRARERLTHIEDHIDTKAKKVSR